MSLAEGINLDSSTVIYRIATRLYEVNTPYGVPFDKLAESERWPWYGTAQSIMGIISEAGFILGQKEQSDDSQRPGGAPSKG